MTGINNERQFGLGGCPQAPPPPLDDPSLFELPPLIIDGIPTPVEKMTQAQLRAFIPLMLKYSMGEFVILPVDTPQPSAKKLC